MMWAVTITKEYSSLHRHGSNAVHYHLTWAFCILLIMIIAQAPVVPLDKSLSGSFNLCKDFSICPCNCEYAHPKRITICVRKSWPTFNVKYIILWIVTYPLDKVIWPLNYWLDD